VNKRQRRAGTHHADAKLNHPSRTHGDDQAQGQGQAPGPPPGQAQVQGQPAQPLPPPKPKGPRRVRCNECIIARRAYEPTGPETACSECAESTTWALCSHTNAYNVLPVTATLHQSNASTPTFQVNPQHPRIQSDTQNQPLTPNFLSLRDREDLPLAVDDRRLSALSNAVAISRSSESALIGIARVAPILGAKGKS
jgi:hypothetical protein